VHSFPFDLEQTLMMLRSAYLVQGRKFEINKQLTAYTLVCKALLPAAQAALYRNIWLKGPKAPGFLLQTLHACPSHRTIIRSLSIYSDRYSISDAKIPDLLRVLPFLRCLALQQWAESYVALDLEQFIPPSLQALYIDLDEDFNPAHILEAMARLAKTPLKVLHLNSSVRRSVDVMLDHAFAPPTQTGKDLSITPIEAALPFKELLSTASGWTQNAAIFTEHHDESEEIVSLWEFYELYGPNLTSLTVLLSDSASYLFTLAFDA
jgi:hypothetical protein